MKSWMLGMALIAAGVVWSACAWFDVAGQRKLFYEGGREEMYDFWMPRMCLEQGYARGAGEFSEWKDGVFVTGDMDKVYPALALLPYKLFPATRAGAWWFSSLCAVVFLGVLVGVRGKCVYALFLSMPFLFSLERGNPVWISAAAVAVFLSWWNDEKPWKRYIAALCLAIAAVMKIAPAALGILYLVPAADRGRDVPGADVRLPLAILVLSAAFLFFVPWLFVRDGYSGIPVMIANAVHHADYVLRTSDFGFIQPWRAVRVAFGLDVHNPWPGMYPVARFSQLCGLAALLYGARKRDILLLVGGMMMAAGNMYYYGALYLLVVLAVEKSGQYRLFPFFCWFVMLCPLQLVIMGHSVNAVLCNCAMMMLMADRVWYNRKYHKEQ